MGVPADALCISVLGSQVFLDTYAADGIRPQLAREVHEQLSVGKVEALLAAPARRFILAERAAHLIGFVQLTLDVAHTHVDCQRAVEIDRLYILERFTSQGIGSELLARAEALSAAAGAQGAWLTAWVGNARALRFYGRHGYRDVGASVYSFEGEHYENRVLARRLDK
jgi:diamine N-acetyltransferase